MVEAAPVIAHDGARETAPEAAPDPEHVERFAALANPIRLAAFRLLMPLGPSGLAAGAIADAMGVPPSTLSTHLSRLCQAGLLRATRQRRRILYAVDVEGTRGLVAYLTEDCCQGRPEVCGYGAKPAQGPAQEPAQGPAQGSAKMPPGAPEREQGDDG